MSDRASRITALRYDYLEQAKVPVAKCNLCGGERFVVVAHTDRYGFDAAAHCCSRCGLAFLNPVMTPPAYGDFYAHVYRPLVSAYHGRPIDAQTIKVEQKQYAEERADFLTPFLSALDSGQFLDIGGSTGVVAAFLVERFRLRATILDPAPLELAEAQAIGLETIAGFIEEYDPGERRFDFVGMFQTVDHLLDIRVALRIVRGLLVPHGLFYADIVDWRAAYLRNGSVEQAIKIDHPYYLTEATFESYLLRGGFEVLRKDYARDHLHIGYLSAAAEAQPRALPSASWVSGQFAEIRAVQNRV